MVNIDHLYREVGRKIRTQRERQSLTQETLASQVSLTRSSITNIEKGRQKLLLHTLFDIAAALGVSPADLLPQHTPEMQDSLDAKLQKFPSHMQAWVKTTVASDRQES